VIRWVRPGRPADAGPPADAGLPPWLAELIRPSQEPVPWAAMIRAALALCGPLALGLMTGNPVRGGLAALGALLVVVVDRGGPYLVRARRLAAVAVLGGAAGLVIGDLAHGRGWITVVALVAVAGVSALLSVVNSTASAVGFQFLIYVTLGTGPLGTVRPWWEPPGLLLAGAAWAILLLVPAWLLAPLAAEQRTTANAYRSIAAMLGAIGTDHVRSERQRAVGALNAAWDDLLARRARSEARDPHQLRLAALLGQTHAVAEAATTLAMEGNRPAPAVTDAIDAIADAIQYSTPAPDLPAYPAESPGARALRDALRGVLDILSGRKPPAAPRRSPRPRPRDRFDDVIGVIIGGRLTGLFALRLMISVGVAAVISEALPVQRSYWVVLTVALVLRPDFGSVFARGVQRGAGTVVGAVVGAAILAIVPYGPLLLIPCAVLAPLLPYGRSRNFGLFTVFQTPLVVVLVDLLAHTGWTLAEDRLIDTLLGCGIALLVGYAPWPMSWHAHLPGQFATAVDSVGLYAQRALPGSSPGRSRLRRQTHRALSDLVAEFQRTMAEPPSVSRRAAVWWPAVVGLESVMDKVTATAVRADLGEGRPSPAGVQQLSAALAEVARAVRADDRPVELPLPGEEILRPVADAVREVQRSVGAQPASGPDRAA
jgi:uncharacterized membrane protein YccC